MVERKRLELLVKGKKPKKADKPKGTYGGKREGAGRPSQYEVRFAKIAQVLCSRGATDADLADAFDVSTITIQNWQSAHPAFGEAVRVGKAEIFDPKVERALAQRALGYSVDTEEVKITKDGDEIRYPLRKHYPPDTTACIFWLKNRQPKKWRDVWKIEHEGKIELDTLTAAQLLEEIRKEAAELGIAVPAAVAQAPVGVAPIKTNGTKH